MPQNKLRFTLISCCAAIGLMFALAYAAVPLYDLFCRVTGYGGTTQRVTEAPTAIGERVINIRFDASLHRDMPWAFSPPDAPVVVRVGEQALAHYQAHNPTNETISGTASFNVTPQKAGYYFSKIECFCFTEQTLKPGETANMPVSFFVDPAIMNDAEMDDVATITLSYTFFKSQTQPEG